VVEVPAQDTRPSESTIESVEVEALPKFDSGPVDEFVESSSLLPGCPFPFSPPGKYAGVFAFLPVSIDVPHCVKRGTTTIVPIETKAVSLDLCLRDSCG
jgi:hypothetical protein